MQPSMNLTGYDPVGIDAGWSWCDKKRRGTARHTSTNMEWESKEAFVVFKYLMCLLLMVLIFIRLLRIRRKRCSEALKQMSFSIRPDDPASLDHIHIDIEALAPVTPAWQRPPILDNSESDHRLSRFIKGDIETTIKVVYEEETGTC